MRTTMRMLSPAVRVLDTRTIKMPRRRGDPLLDPIYDTPEYRAWRAIVLERAGYRCEGVDRYGRRCENARPHRRIFADHIIELRDGGRPFDPDNGRCLCFSHHERKSFQARVDRMKKNLLPGGESK